MNTLNYLSKSPHRNQLEQYVKENLPKLRGNILDVGSKNRRYDYLMPSRPVAVDIVENKKKNVKYGDVHSLPFANNSFDSVVCLEVFEYTPTPTKAISEIYRVLKKGGTLIFSVPFMYKYHEDYLRYTVKYLKRELFKGFPQCQTYRIGNAYTIILTIIRDKITRIESRFLRIFFFAFYSLLVLFIPLSKKLSKDENYASGFFIVAKK